MADSAQAARDNAERVRRAIRYDGNDPWVVERDALAALDALVAENARLTHFIECADTPLMRDVLADLAAANELAERRSRGEQMWCERARSAVAERDEAEALALRTRDAWHKAEADLAAANQARDEAEEKLTHAQGIYDALLTREQAADDRAFVANQALAAARRWARAYDAFVEADYDANLDSALKNAELGLLAALAAVGQPLGQTEFFGEADFKTFDAAVGQHTPAPETPEALAQRFHEAYERLAPSFGYTTRKDSAVPWDDVPEPNRSLMVAVAAEVLAGQHAPEPAESTPDGEVDGNA